MIGLTPRQAEALAFIRKAVARHGRFPTFAEIAAALGAGKTAAFEAVARLTEKGHIIKRGSKRYLAASPGLFFVPAPEIEHRAERRAIAHDALRFQLRRSVQLLEGQEGTMPSFAPADPSFHEAQDA